METLSVFNTTEDIHERECREVPNIRINFDNAGDWKVSAWSAWKCCELCQDDDDCNFAFISSGDCYRASSLSPESLMLGNDEQSDGMTLLSMTNKRDICSVCACISSTQTIDCRGKDLSTLPQVFSGAFAPSVLDLRQNDKLVLLTAEDLAAVGSSITEIRVPRNIAHIDERALQKTALLLNIVPEENELTLMSAISGDQEYTNVCCSQGAQIDLVAPSTGITYCYVEPYHTGIDAFMEPFYLYENPVGAYAMDIYESSELYSGAAASAEACAGTLFVYLCAVNQCFHYYLTNELNFETFLHYATA